MKIECDPEIEANKVKQNAWRIPKLIMQTYKTKEVPEKWIPSPVSIKKHMPDWTHVLMDDEDNLNFVKKHFPDFLPYYESFKYPINRADAIRYMWLYVYGGIYMDLDVEILTSLEPLLKEGDLILVSSGNVGSVITNSFMASRPHHPIWLEVLEEMKRQLPWCAVGRHFEVMFSTGPIMLNKVVKASSYSYTLLPTTLMMPCSVCERPCLKKDAYINPLEGSSWTSWDTYIYNTCMCNPTWVFLLLIVLLILLIVWWRR